MRWPRIMLQMKEQGKKKKKPRRLRKRSEIGNLPEKELSHDSKDNPRSLRKKNGGTDREDSRNV